MPETHVSFAKITATPREDSWSQAYNAGSLFAVLSLEGPSTSEEPLNGLGKELFNNLEAEFFTLEEKTLLSIKQAVMNACEVLPDTIQASLCIAYTKESILYLYVLGQAAAMLRRDGQFGAIASSTVSSEPHQITAVSGYLQDGDIVYLETKQFSDIITQHLLQTTSDANLPNEIGEILSPHIQKSAQGAAAAIILAFSGKKHSEESSVDTLSTGALTEHTSSLPTRIMPASDAQDEEQEEDILEETPHHNRTNPITTLLSRIPHPSFPHPRRLFRLRLIISIGVLVVLSILIISILQTKKQQQTDKLAASFQQIYPAAQKQYDEGVSLLSLNKPLATDDFQAVHKTLTDSQAQFPPGTSERAQIDALLEKTNQQLGTGSAANSSLTPANDTDAPILAAEKTQTGVIAATADSNKVYLLTDQAVLAQQLSGGTANAVIKNNDDWATGVGVGTFGSNIYVLDKQHGLLKFIPSGDSYTKTTYFKDTSPDMTTAVSMTIDGSVYIAKANGSISKFTKGSADTFSLSGLDKPLGNHTKLFTTPDLTNLYILDPDNSRVVEVSKTGAYETAYSAEQMRDAKDIQVSEKDKKLYFLDQDKIYSISLR